VTVCPRCHGEREIVTSPCSQCRGEKVVRTERTISVDIPAGVDSDTRVRLTGEGEPGTFGGPPGNLYVVLHVKPHPLFQRDDTTIMLELDINMAQAALGDKIRIATLDGEEDLSIPAGTQTGDVVRLRGKGVPHLRRNGRGDQLVMFNVLTPTKLNKKQKQLLEELGRTLGKEVVHQPEKGLFQKLRDALGIV
jgi:molecular chaperone DnaJ